MMWLHILPSEMSFKERNFHVLALNPSKLCNTGIPIKIMNILGKPSLAVCTVSTCKQIFPYGFLLAAALKTETQ